MTHNSQAQVTLLVMLTGHYPGFSFLSCTGLGCPLHSMVFHLSSPHARCVFGLGKGPGTCGGNQDTSQVWPSLR